MREEARMRLKDKVALILGAAGKGNMARVIAPRLTAEGCKVVVAGRHEDVLKQLAEELGGAYALADITSKAEVDAAADLAIARFGKIDIGVWAKSRQKPRPICEAEDG